LRAKLLARLIDGKIKLSVDYSMGEIMKDLELELGITLSYMQAWRAREYVRVLVMGRPVDQYKMLPRMCAAIVRGNADSRAYVELDGCRFKGCLLPMERVSMASFWEAGKWCSWIEPI